MADQASTSATMPSDHTNTTTSRIGTIEQPHSRLHALPIELRAMIHEYAVISPDYIPAITAPIAPPKNPSSPIPRERNPKQRLPEYPRPPPQRTPKNPPHHPPPTPPLANRPRNPRRSPPHLLRPQHFPLPHHAFGPQSAAVLARRHGVWRADLFWRGRLRRGSREMD